MGAIKILIALLPLACAHGSTRYNAETHKAYASSGCGKSSPYTQGKTQVATATYGGNKYTYRIYVPKAYSTNTPMPVILQHPGWGVSAKSEETGSGVALYAESLGFIAVFPQGADDNTNRGGPWYSWNAVGSTQSPGQAGATCTNAAGTASYCYTSCSPCYDSPQCDWTTCYNEVTPTGTGYTSVTGYIPLLYDTLESELCIDTTREYASGESNGGMMTYQLAVDMPTRLAAISPEFGSFHRGFNMVPTSGVPVLDLHGTKDTTVPANKSLSSDGWYYTTTDEIFYGNSYAKGWTTANGCSGSGSHWPTKYDGYKDFWCISEGTCTGGDVIRCMWSGGHNWLFNDATANGWLVTYFLLQWTKLTHVGGGRSAGEPEPEKSPEVLTIVSLEEDISPEQGPESAFRALDITLRPAAKGASHYGNPMDGCQDGEDIIFVGTGKMCSPRILPFAPPIRGESNATSDDPSPPKCRLGGVAPSENGCPTDAPVSGKSKAWPICLAKDLHQEEDPYTNGQFHCLLACPCSSAPDCGAASHDHCPSGARCERGELRNGGMGVCTYGAI